MDNFNHVFDKYSEAIYENPNLICLTSGYKIKSIENPLMVHIERANQLDLFIRQVIESIIHFSTYYTDLNTILRVPENGRIEEFCQKDNKKAKGQRCELKHLLSNVIKNRFSNSINEFAKYCYFVPNNPVITECPARFFKDKKGKELTFNEIDDNSYLGKLCCCCQSHADPFDWSVFMYNRIKEFITKENVQVYGTPNGIVKLIHKKNIIVSLLTTLCKYYFHIDSPNGKFIDITLGIKNEHSKKNTKMVYNDIGKELRKNVKNILELKDVLRQFFDEKNQNIVNLIEKTLEECGKKMKEFLRSLRGDFKFQR